MSELNYETIINVCYGGFGLSKEAIKLYLQRTNKCEEKYHDEYYGEYYNDTREDPIMIAILKEIGSKRASGKHAKLAIAHIPIKFKNSFSISEYDGWEGIEIDFARYKLMAISDLVSKDPTLSTNNQLILDIIKEDTCRDSIKINCPEVSKV